jgi:hypothetical protein
MARTKTAFAYTHKAIVLDFERDPSEYESKKPDWGLRRRDQDALDAAMDILDDMSDPEDKGGMLFWYLPPVYEVLAAVSEAAPR